MVCQFSNISVQSTRILIDLSFALVRRPQNYKLSHGQTHPKLAKVQFRQIDCFLTEPVIDLVKTARHSNVRADFLRGSVDVGSLFEPCKTFEALLMSNPYSPKYITMDASRLFSVKDMTFVITGGGTGEENLLDLMARLTFPRYRCNDGTISRCQWCCSSVRCRTEAREAGTDSLTGEEPVDRSCARGYNVQGELIYYRQQNQR